MNRQFPALSGIAILLMVTNHSITLSGEAAQRLGYPPPEGIVGIALRLLRDLGVYAVPTFLFVAGAFAAYAARGDPPKLPKKFVGRSLIHVIRPYVLWSLFFYLIVFMSRGEQYSLAGYVRNLLVGYPYHFVPLLLFFYAVSPVLVRVAYRHGVALLVVVGMYQLLMFLVVHQKVLGVDVPSATHLLAPPVIRGTLSEWAIYYPLGLVYAMHTPRVQPRLQSLRAILVVATILLFVLALLDVNGLINFRLARLLVPVPLVLCLPLVSRQAIPAYRRLEIIGKRSYGIYLSHFVVIATLLWVVGLLVPGLLGVPVVIVPALIAVGIGIPMIVMNAMSRSPVRGAYRSIFG